ncbi:hypothetical protein SLA2020_271170 [Shorea laevis]
MQAQIFNHNSKLTLHQQQNKLTVHGHQGGNFGVVGIVAGVVSIIGQFGGSTSVCATLPGSATPTGRQLDSR